MKVFGYLCLFQLYVICVVRCADSFTLVGDSDQFAFIRVAVHPSVRFQVL